MLGLIGVVGALAACSGPGIEHGSVVIATNTDQAQALATWTISGVEFASGPSSLTITAPKGTHFPGSPSDYVVTDLSNPGSGGTGTPTAGQNTNSVTLDLPSKLDDLKDVFQLTISQVLNPPAGAYPAGDFTVFDGTATAASSNGLSFAATATASAGMAVYPSAVSAASHDTLAFTYTAGSATVTGTTYNTVDGAVYLQVPAGWTPPQTGSPKGAGYVTASAGIASVANGTIEITGLTLPPNGQLTITYGDRSAGGAGSEAPSAPGTVSSFAATASQSAGGSMQSVGDPAVKIAAADQTGAMTVSPGAAVSGSTPTLTFTYQAAAGGLVDGEILLGFLNGPSPPQASQVTASAGIVVSPLDVQDITLPAGGTMEITIADMKGLSSGYTVPDFAFAEMSTASGLSLLVLGTTSSNLVPLLVTTLALPDGTVGSPYTASLDAAGGTTPYTWSISSGSLPPGLRLNTVTGAVYGTPTTVSGSPFTFTVQATDATVGATGPLAGTSQPLSISVGPALAVTTATLPSGSVDAPYDQTLAATGGVPPYSWTTTGLPPGLGVTTVSGSVYAITGTPTAASNGAVTITATDAGGAVQSANLDLTVAKADTTTTLSAGPTPAGSGQAVTLSAAVSGPAGPVQPSGSVEFFVGPSVLGSAPVGTGGTARLTTSALPAGSNTLTAVYPGDANFQPSTSAPVTEVVAGPSGGGVSTVLPRVPLVSQLDPASGPAAGGTMVTITGAHFTGATSVRFGTVAATVFTVTSDSEITATAPPGTGAVDVRVTTPYGTSAVVGGDLFTYAVPTAQSVPTTAQTFSDVPSTYWAYADIEALVARGIVSGYPGGTFRPDAPVSRAEFVKMLDLTAGLKVGGGTTQFTDVPADAWYAPYVAAAGRAGIVDGSSATTFSPDAALTREQMAVMLARALKLSATATLHFSDDQQIDAWAVTGVEEAVAAGVIQGFPDGTLRPLDATTRAQAAAALAMALSHLPAS